MADLRFESLVRACWGIPAEGANESRGIEGLGETQSISVVVTHADGSISIERVSRQEIGVDVDKNDDHVISEVQAERVRRQLASRGVHAVHVHLLKNRSGGVMRAISGADGSSQEPAVRNNAGSILEGGSRSHPGGGRQPSADEVRIAMSGPSGSRHRDHDAGYFEEAAAGHGFDHGLLR